MNRSRLLVAAAVLAVPACAAAQRTAEPSAPTPTASVAPSSSSPSPSPSTQPAPAPSAAVASSAFAPDQILVVVHKDKIQSVQLWQRNEDLGDDKKNLTARDVCAKGGLMSWVVASGLLRIEPFGLKAVDGATVDDPKQFHYTDPSGSSPDVVAARLGVVSLGAKPAGSSEPGKGTIKINAKTATGKLLDGTFEATVCYQAP